MNSKVVRLALNKLKLEMMVKKQKANKFHLVMNVKRKNGK